MEITQLLDAWKEGEDKAFDQLVPLVDDELRKIAKRRLAGERPGHTLQPTALTHEVYLKLISESRGRVASRAHFYALSSFLMRRVLVDHARRRLADKRGMGIAALCFDEVPELADVEPPEVLAMHDALMSLRDVDAFKARLVELRFFGGLTVAETADALSCSTDTISRHWRIARAWLARELRSQG